MVMESIVRDHIMNYVLQNKLFSDKQYGFIKGRSFTLQLLNMLDSWTNCLEDGGKLILFTQTLKRLSIRSPTNVFSVNYNHMA